MSIESYGLAEADGFPEAEGFPEAGDRNLVDFPTDDRHVLEWIARHYEEPIRQLVSQLRPHIERGEYKVIIGEDASGRLPTYALHKIFTSIYREKGFSPISTRYLSGSYVNPWYKDLLQKRKRNLREYISGIQELLGADVENGRVLIVTEHIETGGSLSELVKFFNEAGIDYDIATVAISTNEVHDRLKKDWGHEVIAGSITNSVVPVKQFSGVFKDNPNIHARRLRGGDKEYYERGELSKELFDEYTQMRVNESRKCMGELGEKIAEEYLQSEVSGEAALHTDTTE